MDENNRNVNPADGSPETSWYSPSAPGAESSGAPSAPGNNVYRPAPGNNVYRPAPGNNVYRPAPAAEAYPGAPVNPVLPDLRPAKRSFSRIGFALLALGGVTLAMQFLLSLLFDALGFSDSYLAMWLVNFIPLYLFAVPVCWLIIRRMPRSECESSGLGAKRFFVFLLCCFPLMYGGNIIGNVLSMILSGGSAENPLNNFALQNSWIKVLVMVVLAPICEELVFRKLLIDRAARFGEETAMIFSGVCFGLFHMNLFQFFYATALGILFAYVYVRTRRIQYTILLHMIINFLGGVIAPWILTLVDMDALNMMSSGVMPSAGELASLIPLLIYSFSLLGLSIAGLVLLISRWNRITFRPAECEIPKGSRFKTVYLALGMIFFTVFCAIMTVLTLLLS